jgi:hypothetical protein
MPSSCPTPPLAQSGPQEERQQGEEAVLPHVLGCALGRDQKILRAMSAIFCACLHAVANAVPISRLPVLQVPLVLASCCSSLPVCAGDTVVWRGVGPPCGSIFQSPAAALVTARTLNCMSDSKRTGHTAGSLEGSQTGALFTRCDQVHTLGCLSNPPVPATHVDYC